MVRDFTKSTEERLLRQIDKVSKEKLSGLTDAIGDGALYIGKWVGKLSISDDMKSIKRYHKNVLDMTNMTKIELKDIFDKVYKDDTQYSKAFNDIASRQGVYNRKLAALSNMINPNFEIRSASEIKNAMQEYNKQLKELDGKISKPFLKETNTVALLKTKESVLGFYKAIISIAVDVLSAPASLTKDLATGNIFGPVSLYLDLIDEMFDCASNLVATYTGIITLIVRNAYTKDYALSYTLSYAGVSGLSDVLKVGFGDGKIVSAIGKSIDTIHEGCSLADIGIDILKKPGEVFDKKSGFSFDTKGFKKSDMVFENLFIKNITSKENWIKYQGQYYRLQKYYKCVEIKNIKKAFDYAFPFIDKDTSKENFGKEIMKNSNYYKALDKIKELNELFNTGNDSIDLSQLFKQRTRTTL